MNVLKGKSDEQALAHWYKWVSGGEELVLDKPNIFYNSILERLCRINWGLTDEQLITTSDIVANQIVNTNDFLRMFGDHSFIEFTSFP